MPIEKHYSENYRYPGVAPFTSSQSHIFFGRQQDKEQLFRLIKREQLVVLYGKSGLGKSSLLHAGIIPLCDKENEYSPLVIRFGAWTESKTQAPADQTKLALADGYSNATFLERLIPGDNSLWRYAKNRQILERKRPLLIFDQFEELFSHPEQEVEAFQAELNELLNTKVPLRYLRMADSSESLSEEEEEQLEQPLEARVLLAIRSDRMHLLGRLKESLPSILRYTYELKALTKKDAEAAIVEPAKMEAPFKTPPFEYTPEALAALLSFLMDEKGEEGQVEGILLQMLCEHYERKQIEKQEIRLLGLPEIGRPEQVIKAYYEEKIQSLSAESQEPARRLIEEGLVSEGEAMRLNLHESYIAREFGVGKALLEELVEKRLLRSEPFIRGGYTYELSHDRLVPPVLQARARSLAEKARLETEKQKQELNLARQQAQKERELREKAEAQRRRAFWYGTAGIALAAVAAVALLLAIQRTRLAREMEAVAVHAQSAAEQQAAAAQKARQAAERSLLDFQKEQAEKVLREVNALLERAESMHQKGYTQARNYHLQEALEKLNVYADNPLLKERLESIQKMLKE